MYGIVEVIWCCDIIAYCQHISPVANLRMFD
uniref:Uncharacterized protein n=1 Tax=Anguilla anguilla TaxID=7936 RepID=A0A0E9W343_ANGAN